MTWLEIGPDAPFGLTELPYGVFAPEQQSPRVGVALGDHILDLGAAWRQRGRAADLFDQPSLNAFLAAGPSIWSQTRGELTELVGSERGRAVLSPHLHAAADVTMTLPIEVADYVDFYASEYHAANVGALFRPGTEPLTPNWRHMPIGYHGRAGTVVVSGTPVVRPAGQRRSPADSAPTFGPSRRLDIEAELGWVVGVGSELGRPVPTAAFAEHVFGVVVLNDWSARDLQAWEYVPLGPFLGKSFATSISAWVLPMEALADAAVPMPEQPDLLPYLRPGGDGYAIEVEVELNGVTISRCPYATMGYSPAQMLAHLTSNGASLRTGDLYGSGTISGPAPQQRGSLLELSWNGTEPVSLSDGASRTFLEDGDEVVLRASAGQLRLGEVRGRVSPTP